MGLLSFFKGVGEKVFGAEHAAPTEPAKAAEVEPLKASALLKHIQSLGLPFKKLTVKTLGDKVTLEGQVAKQEDAEKIALAVGNVEGVHEVDNNLQVDAPEPEARYHEVKSGDTLSAIAKQVYGDPMKYGIIFEANKPMLKDPDLIYPGQILRIPQL
jgi:nucleoid-associated protein YgaU